VQGEGGVRGPAFEQLALGERAFVGTLHAFLDHHGDRTRHACDPSRRANRFIDQLRDGNDAGNEARALGFGGVNDAA
jgi:hypothetical protein